jgi:predicted N-acetyltransferase YhbS
MQVIRIEEYRLEAGQRQAIARLLERAFPGYPSGRSYFKQLPSFRFLAYTGDYLAGHLAIEHRMIRVGNSPVRIFGIADLCVDPDLQLRQTGSRLLVEAEKEAALHGVDFMVLIGHEQAFFQKMGYSLQNNRCRWVSIGDHQLIGLVEGRLPGGLWIKSVSGKQWGDGVIDFLGYMF